VYFGIIGNDWKGMIQSSFELFKHINEQLIVIGVTKVVLLIGFTHRSGLAFFMVFVKGVYGTALENIIECKMADSFHEFQLMFDIKLFPFINQML
jgi:hypothetical protein